MIVFFMLFSHSVVSDSLQPHGLLATPWIAAHPSSPGACSNSCALSRWCRPLLLPSIFPSIRVLSNELALRIRSPKYWSFSFSISPSSEYPWLIFFRMNWFDFLAVQRTLKSLLQHHNSKASVLQHSAFFMVQISQLYMTTGKTIDLTIWTFVCNVMSLLSNMPPKFAIAFLPRNKRLLISLLQSPSSAILEPKKRKSVTILYASNQRKARMNKQRAENMASVKLGDSLISLWTCGRYQTWSPIFQSESLNQCDLNKKSSVQNIFKLS